MKSTHKAEIVPVVLEDHPNADSLSIVKVFGYTCVCRTEDWQGIDKAAYIVPDTLVDTTRPEFSFLPPTKSAYGESPWHRVKVCKLRGVVSMGLLVPAPAGFEVGDDASEYLGIQRWEPHMSSAGAENVPAPPIVTTKYDVDALLRYDDIFQEGEPVYITEKIHGENARYVYVDGKQYCGSRTNWKREGENVWWRALKNSPDIGRFCQNNPGVVLYGEVAGHTGKFDYGVSKEDRVKFFAFDIKAGSDWYKPRLFNDALIPYEIDLVPTILWDVPFHKDKVISLAEGQSTLSNHVREGVVVKPMEERTDLTIGRVCLKVVGNGYYKKG